MAMIVGLSTAAFMWVLLYAPTPYVVYEPGIAVPVKSMVSMEEGDRLGGGDFLLTAVKLTEPNFLHTFQSMWNTNMEVHLKRDVLRGYSKDQYADRLNVIMQGSQNNAIEAAYRYAGFPYESRTNGIVISDVHAGSSSFKAGDRLLGINGDKPLGSATELLDKLQQTSKDKPVQFDIERSGKLLNVTFAANIFDSTMTNEQRLEAIGIMSLTELRSLEPADEGKRLTITAGDIGGPSAGLVFALQAVDLLTKGDLSGGLRIAATGTITVDGKVGAIGGIKQKIVIASKEGAQLFLAPADNFEEAEAKAKALGTPMKVVSVRTLQEAMDQIQASHNAST
jgi:PDZ domain-containing protein